MPPANQPSIEPAQGFETTGYVHLEDGQPVSDAGITIGAGVDLGHWCEDSLRARRVPQDIIDQLKPYLGMKGWPALQWATDRPLTLTVADARMLSSCIRAGANPNT